MRMRHVFLAVCAMGCAVAALPANGKAEDAKPVADNEFVTKATLGGLHEVELGKIASANANNADVKKFGELMAADHGKANEELKTVAAKASILVPDKLSSDKMKELDRFRNLKGVEFDKAYMSHMVKDHEEAVTLFSKATKDVKNPGLKDFADKTLPALQEHLKVAKKLNDDLAKQ